MDFDFEKTKRDNYYQWRERQNITGPIESYESWKNRKKQNTTSKPKKIKAQDLTTAITQEIEGLIIEVEVECEEELLEIGMETVKELRAISPKDTGKYAKSWKYKVEKDRLHNTKLTVYSSNPQLTRLLENGHLNRDGTTRSRAIPHISIANEHAQKKAKEKLGD